ncbi:MAG: T9SS type A sorting domain-containing protein [Bacteroidetes bacterium]|nr:T9SS type A sorting domain-containing protein [Bacteroidota bacterium]HET6245035.1 PA domain-containing protein [Bacteroidia bacterium]
MKRKILLLFGFFTALAINNQANAQVVFNVKTPLSMEGNYDFTYSSSSATGTWGADLSTVAITDTLVIIRDNAVGDSLGCTAAINSAQIAGQFAVVYRGSCQFGKKALEAQNAGATAVIIINNVAGGAVGMAGGDFGSQVTIPVVMISAEDGALFRSAIDAGTMTAFIGSKAGLFVTDLGFDKSDIIVASGAAIPKVLAQNGSDFNIPVGLYVYNYGSANQTNVTVSAQIMLSTSSVYSQSTTINLASGADAFVALPTFSLPSYSVGEYTMTYSITPSVADEDPSDNSVVSKFRITDSQYSKVMLKPDPNNDANMLPITTGSTSAGGVYEEFYWCTAMKVNNANGAQVHGFSFSTRNNFRDLTGSSVRSELYKWNNISPSGFDSLVQIGSILYDYESDLQDTLVYSYFLDSNEELQPIALENNQLYLACVVVFEDSTNIGYSNAINHNASTEKYRDAYNPVGIKDLSTQASVTWYTGFSGGNSSPAITIQFGPSTVGVEENKISTIEHMPYPNPANNYISIPLKGNHAGMVELKVIDVTGKIVKSETINVSNSNVLTVSTSDIENGIYFFQLKSGDNKATSFSVVIAK